jgi:predicted acylesterase/phospholipase RssA
VAQCQNLAMPHPSSHITAFVLAGGGTKGSFEVGVLQYLIEVERVTPDIVTATSAGAILATVLAQARTQGEFAQRVQEIGDDVLAMTQMENVFGKQAWLRALDGTGLGGVIEHQITEGTRPPFPLGSTARPDDEPGAGAAGDPAARRRRRQERRRRRRYLLRLLGGAGFRLSKVRRHLHTSGSAVLNLDPLREALRHGGAEGIRPVDPALIARPGLQLRLAVTALRAGVLRYVTEDGSLVEADAHTPAPPEARGPVSLVDGAIASASVPMVFPPHPLGDDDYVDGGVTELVPVRAAAQLGATRIIAVVALPLAVPRDDRDYAKAPAAVIGLRSLGMIGVADRQRSNLDVHLGEGTTLTTIAPVFDVVGLFEVEPGLLRINRDYGWLRAADVLAEGDSALRTGIERQTEALIEARRDAWVLEESLWTGEKANGSAPGVFALLREHKARVRDLIVQRKQLGFALPDECDTWWNEYEVHATPRSDWLPVHPGAETS